MQPKYGTSLYPPIHAILISRQKNGCDLRHIYADTFHHLRTTQVSTLQNNQPSWFLWYSSGLPYPQHGLTEMPDSIDLTQLARTCTGNSQRSLGCIPFRSETCSSHHHLYECYPYWCAQIKEAPRYHRKQWEFVYIAQALWERGMLKPGMKGLGFGVGQEPLVALFASHGCTITATDMDSNQAQQVGWTQTNQHAGNLARLNAREICGPEDFEELVAFETVDMNHIPPHLHGYDFCWSACCFEHLGSIPQGLEFVKNSLKTLKPGGLAIHTTEFNLSSNTKTIKQGGTVLYREHDLQNLLQELQESGHHMEPLLIHKGSQPLDDHVDTPPYSDDRHLRLLIGQYDVTSAGLIIRKRTTA